MRIGNYYIWTDADKREISLQISNCKTSTKPIELYLTLRARAPEAYFYASDDDEGPEIRVAVRFLWLSLNARICGAKPMVIPEEKERQWGWSFLNRDLNLFWGDRRINWPLPFISTEHLRTEILSLGKGRVVYATPEKGAFETAEYAKRKKAEAENTATFDYCYELETGEKQHVKAAVHVARAHRVRKWTPFKSFSDSIDVNFSAEVGPRRGSWKGGCIGCAYTMRKGETARMTLRRMESERRFER